MEAAILDVFGIMNPFCEHGSCGGLSRKSAACTVSQSAGPPRPHEGPFWNPRLEGGEQGVETGGVGDGKIGWRGKSRVSGIWRRSLILISFLDPTLSSASH